MCVAKGSIFDIETSAAISQPTVVYTGGTFDLFHEGHVELLRECRKLAGDRGQVVVALNTDEFVEEFKGKAPVVSYAGRLAVLQACRHVDRVVPNNSGADSRPTIDGVHPLWIAIGSDWQAKDYYAQMGFDQEWLDKRGITVVYFHRSTGESTTGIKQRVASPEPQRGPW